MKLKMFVTLMCLGSVAQAAKKRPVAVPAAAPGAVVTPQPVPSMATRQAAVFAEINRLQASGQSFEAYRLAAQNLERLRAELGIDQVVARVETNFTQQIQEVITRKNRDWMNLNIVDTGKHGWWARLLRYSTTIGLSLALDYEKVDNETQLITQNAAEVAAFPLAQARDGQKLEAQVKQYIINNAEGIFYLKLSGAYALRLMNETLAGDRRLVSEADLRRVWQSVSMIRFDGLQQVNFCVKTDYAAYTDSESVDYSGAFSLARLISFGFEGSTGTSNEHLAHSVSQCSNTENRITLDESPAALSVDFAGLDKLLEQQVRVTNATFYFGGLGAIDNPPDFNNPYLLP